MVKRFLRDRVLDEMIEELQQMRLEMTRDAQNVNSEQHFATLHVMYETSKVVLERLEEVLDRLREGVTNDEMIVPIADAAMHLQNGLREIHLALKEHVADEISAEELQSEINAAQARGLYDPSEKGK